MELSSDSEDEYGHMERPTLLGCLKQILEQYPNTSVFKEMLQNAEDAGASEFKVMVFDADVKAEENEKSKYFKSPGLFIHNNAVFTEKDWKGISSISNSIKREDVSTVGKFGLGFKSVFHLTDFAVIISGDQLMIIDPFQQEERVIHKVYLRKIIKKNWFSSFQKLKNGFSVFGLSASNLQNNFNGTLFWFPLRQKPSELSSEIFSSITIEQLLELFKKEAKMNLLFLLSVRLIKVLRYHSEDPIYEAYVQSADCGFDLTVAEYRRHLKKLKSHLPEESLSCTCSVECVVTHENESNVDEWFVNHYFVGTKDCTNTSLFTLSHELSNSPCGGVAAPLFNNNMNGHTFCFLPLPFTAANKTSLPFHINGFFSLSPDRDHVKWAAEDELCATQEKSHLWNTALMEEVILKSYLRVIFTMQKCLEDATCIYNLIPVENDGMAWNWKKFIGKLHDILFKEEIFYTQNRGGSWVDKNHAIFNKISEREFTRGITKCLEQNILTVLSYYDVNLVKLPRQLMTLLYRFDSSICCISWEYVVSTLKREAIRENGYKSVPPNIKEDLLYYLLLKKDLHILAGLSLLPKSNGNYVDIAPRQLCQKDDIVWLCTKEEKDLFPLQEDYFVGDLQLSTFDTLKQLLDGNWNVDKLKPTDVDVILRRSVRGCTIKKTDSFGRKFYVPIYQATLTSKWLDHVWSFLYENEIIEQCVDIPLIPLDWDSTCPPKKEIYKLISLQENFIFDLYENFSSNLVSCLKNFGIFVLKDIPQQIKRHFLKTCSKKLDRQVLKMIEDIFNSHSHPGTIVDKFNSTTNEEKKEFGMFLKKNIDLIPSHIPEFLKNLEIFPSGNVPQLWSGTFSSISLVNVYITFCDFPVSLPNEMLLLWEQEYQDLARKIGAEHNSLATVMLKTLSSIKHQPNRYSKNDFIILINYFVANISMWNKDCLDLARTFPCLKDRNDEWRKPSDLFISTPTLQILFMHHPFKIVKDGYDEKILDLLAVKTEKHLCTNDLLLISQYISHNHDKPNIPQISYTLLCTMEGLYGSPHLQEEELFKFYEITFIVHEYSRPKDYPQSLSWFGEKQRFSSPKEVKSLQMSSVLGSVCCLINDKFCQKLSNYYRWQYIDKTASLIKQILIIKDNWSTKYTSKLNVTLFEVYEYMFTHVKMECVKSDFEKFELLFNGSRFFPPSCVLLACNENKQFEYDQYIGVMVDELSEYHNRLKQLGCLETMTVDKCRSVIKDIALFHENNIAVDNEKIEKDRNYVIKLLKHALKIKNDESVGDLLVPIDTVRLNFKPAEDCTVYPISERRFSLEEEEEGELFLVHKDVPDNICIKLGIPTFTQRFLSENSATELISDFGQQEPLTTRLNSILDGYKDGVAVFKELVQNADDAGATDIMFMYDERENDDIRHMLMSPGMAECQGAALWSFNNALFSEDDFSNIIKLAGKTKLRDNTKIGKFGLGFCAVYNITDVPSILSGDSLVIFDPHASHLGQAIKNSQSPGLRIKLNKNKLLKKFSNQFRPYHGVFECDILSETSKFYKGTLIRLPIRTPKQSEVSKIKKKMYSKIDMKKLIHMFLSMAGNILLFTQHIKKITFLHLLHGQAPNDAKEIFSAVKTKTTFIESPIKQTATIVKEKILGEKPKDAHWIEHVMLHLITNFSVEGVVIDENSKTDWLISWYAKMENMRQLVETCQNSLPLGAVAVLKENNAAKAFSNEMPFGLYNKGHIFCFLPLPEEYNIPVHINGCFEVNSERSIIVRRTGEEMETTQNDWNLSLFQNSVCKAYTNALVELAQEKNHQKDYWEIWPKDIEEKAMIHLLRSFYNIIVLEDPPVFYQNENKFHSYGFNTCIFLSPALRYKANIGDIAFEIFKTFGTNLGVPVELPLDVYMCLITLVDSGVVNKRIVTTEMFFVKVFLENIEVIDPAMRNELLLFALKSNNDTILDSLKSYSCIPTLPRGRLRKPSEIMFKNTTWLADFFTDEDERFAQEIFSAENIVIVLKNLGAIFNKLPSDFIIDRANSVEKLPYTEACKRSLLILTYLQKFPDDKILYQDLKNVPFISVMNQPSNWPIDWPSKNKDSFQKPTNVYHSDCLQLCGCSQRILNNQTYKTLSGVDGLFRHLSVKYVNNVLLEDVMTQVEAIDKLSTMQDLQSKAKEFIAESMKEILVFFAGLTSMDDIKLQNRLKHKKFICIDNQIFCPDKLTFEKVSINCSPLLVSVKCKNGFFRKDVKEGLAKVGVSKSITLNQITNGLYEIAKKVTLEEWEVEVYINLLQLYCTKSELKEELDSDLCIPDTKRQLKSCSDLCFLDVKMPADNLTNMYFVHKSVSVQILQYFSIQSYSQRRLHDVSTFMSFGQKEDLVVRLRNLIKEYAFDFTIFNELIQNAEDAGAREVHFVLDKRQHSIEGILDERYKEAQGPALCVYNDSCFTENDLIGIQNLGSGSKAMDPSKIGQFGLGFNVVYNITDVPSFLTIGDSVPNGSTFCVFDPLFSYCACKSYERPGIRLPNVDHLKTNFPGVYECYLQEKSELPNKQGTWFRFPLRTKAMAEKSKLKDEEISVEVIEQLFDEFKTKVNVCLLFLRSVQKITFSKIDQENGLKKIAESISSISSLQSDVKNNENMSNDIQKEFGSLSNIHEICYLLDIGGTEKKTWLISSVFGYNGDNCLPSELKTSINEGHFQLLPDCSVAVQLEPQIQHLNGQLFCYLPLPCITGLPVHVNGRFSLTSNRKSLFQDVENQKTLNGQWNVFLLHELVAKAYMNAIKWLKSSVNIKKIEFYYSIFPVQHEFFHRFIAEEVAKGFYHQSCESMSLIWPMEKDENIEWVSIRGTNDFDDMFVDNIADLYSKDIKKTLEAIERRHYKNISSKTSEISDLKEKQDKRVQCLTKQLKGMNLKLVSMPDKLFKSINHYLDGKCAIQFFSPKLLLKFLRHFLIIPDKESSSHIHKTHFKTIENFLEVVLYVRTEIKDVMDLKGLPLCLTQDENLHVFGSFPCIVSKFQSLLPASKHKFLHVSLIKMLHIFNNLQSNAIVQKLDLTVFKIEFPNSFNINIFKGSKAILYQKLQNMPDLEWYEQFWKFIDSENIKTDLVKEELYEWKIVIGKSKEEVYIAPVKRGTYLCQKVEEEKSLQFGNLQKIFVRFDLPFSEPFVPLRFIAQYSNTESILSFVHFHKKHFYHAGKDIIDILLKYFQDNLNFAKLDSENIKKFKEIPLLFVENKVYPICYFEKILILNFPAIPLNGLHMFSSETSNSKIALLQNINFSQNFIEQFGIKVIDTIQNFYSDLLQELVYRLDVNDIEKHLDFLVESRYFLLPPLIDSLKKIKLVKFKGRCVKASNFFDSSLNICKELCESFELLPVPYNNPTYLDLMIQAGLQTTVPLSKFEEFAIKVSKLDVKNENALRLSKILFSHLQGLVTSEIENLLKGIKNIPCICPEKIDDIYQNICPQYDIKTLISYSEAVHMDNFLLVWSTQHILPSYTCICLPKLLMQPSLDNICSHIHMVCSNLSKNQEILMKSRDQIYTIMEKFYAYLNKADEAKIKHFFLSTPFIYVHSKNTFAYAHQVTLDRQCDFNPFLVELPIEFTNYFNLFKIFGATETISVRQLVYVLNTIAKDTLQTNQRLVSKEIKCVVVKAYERLLLLICEENFDFQQELNGIKSMFLISSKGSLHQSNQLFFGDILDWLDRLEDVPSITLLKNFRQKSEVLQSKFKCFPANIKPKFLSDIVEEQLEEFIPSTKLCDNIIELKSILKSEKFLAIMKAACKNSMNSEQIEKMISNFKNLKIICAESLKTVLVYEKAKIETTKRNELIFLNFIESDSSILYLVTNEHQFILWVKSIEDRLNFLLLKFTFGLTNKSKLKKIMKNLHCLDILEIMFLEETTTKDPFIDLIGKYVPEELYDTLIQDFVSFEKGEVVALEVLSPDEQKDESVLYIFVQVKDCENEEENILKQIFTVDTGVCLVRRHYLDLYKISCRNESSHVDFFPGTSQPLTIDNLKEIKKEILKILCDAWGLPEKERKIIIKRLRLKWHPDKNIGQERLSNEVTKFIHEVIRRLEKGELNDLLEELKKHDCCNNWTYDPENDDFEGEYFKYSKNVFRTGGWHMGSTSGYAGTKHNEVPNQVPAEAKRYFKQAKLDYQLANYLFSQENAPPCHNWILYLCHQACEKSIKAYGWAVDSNKMNTKSHNLRGILNTTPGFILEKIPTFFTPSNYMGLRYPDVLKLPHIPEEVFCNEDFKSILSATKELLSRIKDNLPLNV